MGDGDGGGTIVVGQWGSGWQGIRGTAGRWGKSIFKMLIREIMEILHTTGIHKQVGDPKKCEKRFHLLPSKKDEIRGLTFFHFFSMVENTGNTQMIAA